LPSADVADVGEEAGQMQNAPPTESTKRDVGETGL
jgi:hypothetical protein